RGLTHQANLAGVLGHQAEHRFDEGALPCPVGTDDRAHHPAWHTQVHAVEHDRVVVPDAQPLDLEGGHRRGAAGANRIAAHGAPPASVVSKRSSHGASAAGRSGALPPSAVTMARTLWTSIPM